MSIARIGFLLSEMNEAEIATMTRIAERIHAGRRTYGPLDPKDGRDWKREAMEELVDFFVYEAIGDFEALKEEAE